MKHKTIRRLFWITFLPLTVAFAAPFLSGCTDEQDICKAFCRKAAECLQCGSTANLERCQSVCVDMSIDDKKALGDCTEDCMIMRTCPAFTQHPDLNPCRP
jgi:hypothetical protein